jgi:outer membrane murein-binding lipoprotein Lpp
MKETFETNLAASQREEMENQKAYEDLKAAKEEEIAAGQSQVDTKTVQLGNTDEKNAQSKEDLEDTQECLAADTAFLANLKERCASMDSEYEERTKTRQLEIQAVSKALAFLASDEAHDLFSRTLGFVQVSASSKRRDAVVKSLTNAAKKFNSPQLATLAVRARLDAFTKVKKSIEDMVDKLIKEKEDEIKHKDFCIEEINSNERDTEMKERDRDDLIAKIDDLAMTIDTLSKAIEVLKAEVAEMQVQMKRAGEDREKANKDFQMTVADQRATQKLLTAALGILKGFYEKAALISVNQHSEKQTTGQAPPPGFKSYEKNAASGGVMGMMSGIINDAKAMEAEAIRGEESAQKTYEEFVMDTNASIEEKVKDITAKTEAKAKAETAKVEATTERDDVLGELEQLANENADLHKSCDFTLKNFEIRQTARDEEVEALKQSIAMFSGASFSAFLSKV